VSFTKLILRKFNEPFFLFFMNHASVCLKRLHQTQCHVAFVCAALLDLHADF
jgi:hypothetical protein